MTSDGIIIVDKPAGPTSHDVVARVRRILKMRRVGHTGTLDPFATGVLVVCFGRATRLVQFLANAEKEYVARMRLGLGTDTGDVTGQALPDVRNASGVSREALLEAFKVFTGEIEQVPPMFAAKKIGGKKLYEFARRGIEIERQPVRVRIPELELLSVTNSLSAPEFVDVDFRVVCSSGTYIRTLAVDIGQRVGLPAHLLELRRTRAGLCGLEQSTTLEQLEEYGLEGRLDGAIIQMDQVTSVLGIPGIQIDGEEVTAVTNGRAMAGFRNGLEIAERNYERIALVTSEGRLIAVAEFDGDASLWRPRVVLQREDERHQITE
jgi:tRNA pseudouridine55 synthase